MVLLKQSTAQTLRVGPAMDPSDGVTPVTTVDLSTADQAELLKATGATVDISAATFAAITGVSGWYDLSLTTSHTDTLGMLTVVVQDTSACTPMFARAMVLPANVYDSLVGGSDQLDINVLQWSGTAVPTTEAGGPGVIRRNTAAGGAVDGTTVTLDGSASTTDDFYNGCGFEIIGGTGVGQARIISDYTGSSKLATMDRALITAADATSVFRVFAGSLGPTTSEIATAANTAVEGGQVGSDAAAILTDTGTTIPALIGTPVADLATDIAGVQTGVTTLLGADVAYKKNVAVTAFVFYMQLTDGTPGVSLTVTIQISKDGGAFATLAGAVTEIGNGWYKVPIAQSEMNADEIALTATATGANQTNIKIRTQS